MGPDPKHHFPKHRTKKRVITAYDFEGLRQLLAKEDRTTKGVNAADFATFA